MKKLLVLLFSAAVLSFSGCADKGTQASAGTVAEPIGEISTYLQGTHISVADAEAKLSAGGFEVLATYESVKNAHTIIFTCPSLKEEAAKPNRANIAVMKLLLMMRQRESL